MKLPSITELIPEQRDIYDALPDSSILVVGPPGSGKTSIAIWRACLLVSPELKRSVVLVTRNRLLTAVAEQLARENEGGAEIRAITMHRYILKDYFSYFKEFAPKKHLNDPYDLDWEAILKKYETANIKPTLDHLIVDEGQNLPIEFIIWAVRFKAKSISIFADEDQSTTKGGCRIVDLNQAGFTEALLLTVNHRNTQEIADVIAHFHAPGSALPPAAPRRGGGFDRPNLMPVASWEGLADTVTARLTNRAESIGVIVFRACHVEKLAVLLKQRLPAARIDSYTSDSDPGAEKAIQMRDYGVTILSGESAIGLEFDTLYLQDIFRSLPTSPLDPVRARRLYMLCARARDKLVLVNGPVITEKLTNTQLTSLPPHPILDR